MKVVCDLTVINMETIWNFEVKCDEFQQNVYPSLGLSSKLFPTAAAAAVVVVVVVVKVYNW